MKCMKNKPGCVGYSNGECISIENCIFQSDNYNFMQSKKYFSINLDNRRIICDKEGYCIHKSGRCCTAIKNCIYQK